MTLDVFKGGPLLYFEWLTRLYPALILFYRTGKPSSSTPLFGLPTNSFIFYREPGKPSSSTPLFGLPTNSFIFYREERKSVSYSLREF
jgi:hypothetical protein